MADCRLGELGNVQNGTDHDAQTCNGPGLNRCTDFVPRAEKYQTALTVGSTHDTLPCCFLCIVEKLAIRTKTQLFKQYLLYPYADEVIQVEL